MDAKKTPSDATAFEREQLRFFLSKRDAAAILVELNPSLSWLPVLAELRLIDAKTQLAPWIQKNFSDVSAVREVAANIHFFGAETADILEWRLNQTTDLASLLMKSWRLIVRHMRNVRKGIPRHEWFELAPRVKNGESSTEVLERVANVLRPKLQVSKRLMWGRDEERTPENPSDLMAIDFEIEEGVTANDVLAAWPSDATAALDQRLLLLLSNSLNTALAEASDAGVEDNEGYSLTDSDVPSVAEHKQNAHRTGFLPIVRVAAELWTRLVRKERTLAIGFLTLWEASPYKMMRRLATFAAADKAVEPKYAVSLLLQLPLMEFFMMASSVEVYRLLDTRWPDFTKTDRSKIEQRIVQGPPASWFRSEQDQAIDRRRYNVLGYLIRNGYELGSEAQATYDAIISKWPDWELRPKEQAGFDVWHGEATFVGDDASSLDGVPDDNLLARAKELANRREFGVGDSWQSLCRTETPRAIRGLRAAAANGEWPEWAWHPLLWTSFKQKDAQLVEDVARLLLQMPDISFAENVGSVAWWLDEATQTLATNELFRIWDRLALATAKAGVKDGTKIDLNTSINHSAGHLAEILLKAMPSGSVKEEVPIELRSRLDVLMALPGDVGELARIRLARDVSYLFERVPEWTRAHLLPLFDWSSPKAAAAWSARKYSNYIGSPQLIEETKSAFLALFDRADLADEDLRVYADWLTIIMIANQTHDSKYPITATEARSALRMVGEKGLPSVGHRLAVEMGKAKAEQKLDVWRNVVRPVFEGIWPLDVNLQTSASTFKLVQVLRESGQAFPEAVKVIVPFIQVEKADHHTSVFSLAEAHEEIYASSPGGMLDLVNSIVGDAAPRSIYGLRKTLERIQKHAPHLANETKFQKLMSLAE
jgi:hypothetical protein